MSFKHLPILVLLPFFAIHLESQSLGSTTYSTAADSVIVDLTTDALFFEQQKEAYQRWLDHSGLGQVLRVETIKVEPNELALYLSFPYNDIDTIMVAWQKLKQTFDQTRPISLERQLFYKMVNLMEVRQTLANIQIYDTYDLRKEPLFFRGIYFAEGNVKVETSDPRSKIREVNIRPPSFEEMKKTSVEAFKQRYSRNNVYNSIYEYAKARYERTVCDNRDPKVRILENEEVLRFEVFDLCKEVLIDDSNPLLCRILQKLGHHCNWVKRELLVFTITYKSLEDGFRLHIEIDGKYGSGYYDQVRRGGYLSMEIDFDDYLERYADEFKERLKSEILNP